MIDIGVNLTNKRFDKDRLDVISRAKSTSINALIVTGTSIEESQKALELCQAHPNYLYCTAGVHPHDADHVSDNYLQTLMQLLQQPQVKAVGECGLDFNRNFSTPVQQQKVFDEQIALAAQVNMPLFLHQRDAFDCWYQLLSPYLNKVPAMVSHCFTGSKAELKTCLDAGMYIGITGWICDERRGDVLRDIIKYIPLERLLIETDAPYLTPRTIKPRPKSSRNEPSYLSFIVTEISNLTGYSIQKIMTQTILNTQDVFAIPTSLKQQSDK